METRGSHVSPVLKKRKGSSGSVPKGTARPVNIRIQAANRHKDHARKEPDSQAEVASQSFGPGREERQTVERSSFYSSADHRYAGSQDSEINWGVTRPSFSNKLSRHPGYVKRSRQSLGSVLLSVGAALVLGTIMGFSVLSLFFSDDPALSPRSIDSHLERTRSVENEPAAKGQESILYLADLHAVLLQGGSFAEKERAQQAIQSHRSKGRAAVMTDASPHRIYLGVAINRDDALKLSVTYQKEKVDVYLKDLNAKGDRVRLAEETLRAVKQDLPRFVEDGHRIFHTLAESTTSFLGGSPSTGFPDPSNLAEVHRRMMDAGTRLDKQLPAAVRPHLQNMMMAADQAVHSAREANQNPSAALIWQTQEGLVRYALAYEALLASLK